MIGIRLSVIAIAIAASAASTLNPDPLPIPDECSAPSNGAVESIRLVHPDSDAVMQDYEIHELIFGSQGGTMVRMRFGLEGDAIPSCIETTLVYEKCLDSACGSVVPDTSYPRVIGLRTYEDSAGRITKEHYAVLPYQLNEGDLARISIAIGPDDGRLESSVLAWLGVEGTLDAPGPDAGMLPVPDAGL